MNDELNTQQTRLGYFKQADGEMQDERAVGVSQYSITQNEVDVQMG